MKRIVIVLTAIIFLYSCGNHKKKSGPLDFSNDFEGQIGWTDIPHGTLMFGNAHSGKVLSKTTPENQYSFGFHRFLKDLSTKRIKKAEISVWVNLSSANSTGSLVLAIDSAGTGLFWKGIPTKDFTTTPDKWTEMKGSILIPETVSRNGELKVYFWNSGKDPILVDDIDVSLKEASN
jgi:hypothetical protein